jgi:hypothetical protein
LLEKALSKRKREPSKFMRKHRPNAPGPYPMHDVLYKLKNTQKVIDFNNCRTPTGFLTCSAKICGSKSSQGV